VLGLPDLESIPVANEIRATALHNFRLCSVFNLFDNDLGFWVKPQSTT
jgi:hypothetical protein